IEVLLHADEGMARRKPGGRGCYAEVHEASKFPQTRQPPTATSTDGQVLVAAHLSLEPCSLSRGEPDAKHTNAWRERRSFPDEHGLVVPVREHDESRTVGGAVAGQLLIPRRRRVVRAGTGRLRTRFTCRPCEHSEDDERDPQRSLSHLCLLPCPCGARIARTV